jgi:hypothetical protein
MNLQDRTIEAVFVDAHEWIVGEPNNQNRFWGRAGDTAGRYRPISVINEVYAV